MFGAGVLVFAGGAVAVDVVGGAIGFGIVVFATLALYLLGHYSL